MLSRYPDTNITVPAQTDVLVDFTDKDFDPGNLFDLDQDAFTAPTAGLYQIGGSIRVIPIVGNDANSTTISVFKNGAVWRSVAEMGTTAQQRFTFTFIIRLAAGDSLQFFIRSPEQTTLRDDSFVWGGRVAD